ncbi:hypothetical protein AAZX31_06G248500 [Glycine max]
MALHLSTALTLVVCRARSRIWFWNCKGCVEHKKAESLYICGCPGKSLSMEKVKDKLLNWAKELHRYRNNKFIVADELDYLITKDRIVLHDHFMLTTFPFSRCMLIGKFL